MVKINTLELENIKRIRAVRIEPSQNGLTVIGGRNNQGKTSVLDAIAWALGGNKFRPSQAQREGSLVPPHLKIQLSNGLVVERKGKNSDLKVTDPAGNRSGQQLLDEFIEQLALDLPKFLNASGREKAETLLQIIGVKDRLEELERAETQLYNQRHAIGQMADRKAKFARELPQWDDVPEEPVSASELIRQQQEILARNGENQRKRARAAQLENQVRLMQERVDNLAQQLQEASEQCAAAMRDLATAQKSAEDLQDESTAQLEQNIRDIEALNVKIRANLDKEKAEDDARQYRDQYDSLSQEIDRVRNARMDLLNNAHLPLPGLSVENHELTYNGQQWDNMSGSDQLRVATAIVRRLNPECGFVLLDKLEQMDVETLREFGEWLEQEGLQAIATRVSTGPECSIIIEDGYDKGQVWEPTEEKKNKLGGSLSDHAVSYSQSRNMENKTWKVGEF